jgi:hypothetical protein
MDHDQMTLLDLLVDEADPNYWRCGACGSEITIWPCYNCRDRPGGDITK